MIHRIWSYTFPSKFWISHLECQLRKVIEVVTKGWFKSENDSELLKILFFLFVVYLYLSTVLDKNVYLVYFLNRFLIFNVYSAIIKWKNEYLP